MGTLGTVGIADKGNYNPATTYVLGNSVYYGGSTWVAKKNNLTGITPEEGENWKYLARGFGSDSLSQIEATDTSGVLGTSGATVVSQALIDAIADKVMTKLIPYTNIVNNFLATDPNTVLSGPMGKSLKDQLDTTNSNLSYKTYETKFTINSDPSVKVIFTKYAELKRFTMYALNEWYAAPGTEIKLCDLPAAVIPSGGGFYKYMQYDTGKYGYVSIHDNAMYLLLITALSAGDKVTLQDVYF